PERCSAAPRRAAQPGLPGEVMLRVRRPLVRRLAISAAPRWRGHSRDAALRPPRATALPAPPNPRRPGLACIRRHDPAPEQSERETHLLVAPRTFHAEARAERRASAPWAGD